MRQKSFYLMLALVMMSAASANAQVTIGEIKDPEAYSILELVSNGQGGLRMPQLTTEERIALTTEAFESAGLAQGLAIFNTDTKCLEFWNGTKWITISQAAHSIATQPEKFTFYESPEGDQGDINAVKGLEFEVVGGGGEWTYQWYQLVGINARTRVGKKVGETGTVYASIVAANTDGANTDSFTPKAVIKGTNRHADYVGFYRFYCVATNTSGTEVTSDIAEVAVGCGAKTIDGEWLSFMCFNVGADLFTIAEQQDYSFNLPHSPRDTYIQGEEELYGDLFQWGRVPDGHEKRNSPVAAYIPTAPPGVGASVKVPGSWQQALDYIDESETVTEYAGNFIKATGEEDYNWAYGQPVTYQNLLWRNYRYTANDPCAMIDADGNYNENEAGEILTTATNWRIPTTDEWRSIYKGNSAAGIPGDATANTWVWYGVKGRGFEIKPAGAGTATTLFLPAGGYRHVENGWLYNTANNGSYWSSSVSGNTYYLYFDSNLVIPAYGNRRGHGFSVRCIKN
jgi:uncharacterized protein (TIGR02145 family)